MPSDHQEPPAHTPTHINTYTHVPLPAAQLAAPRAIEEEQFTSAAPQRATPRATAEEQFAHATPQRAVSRTLVEEEQIARSTPQRSLRAARHHPSLGTDTSSVALKEAIVERRVYTDRIAPVTSVRESSEEVAKLRELLSSATSELSRQISSVAHKQGSADDGFQLKLAQKKIMYMEAKCVLSEGKAEEALQKASALEIKNTEMQGRFNALSSSSDTDKSARLVHDMASLGGINQSVELIKAQRECQSLQKHYDELLHRHTVQQRSLQLLDQQKSSEAKMLSDVSLRLSDAEQYTHTLESRSSLAEEANVMLKAQLQSEVTKIETLRIQEESRHQESLARAHVVILAQRSEIDEGKGTQGGLQQELASLQQLAGEFKAQKAGEILARAVLDKTSFQACTRLLTRPVFNDWKDVVYDARTRRWTLHSLFSGILGGWHRRFRKNHFLAWKFCTKTVLAGFAEKIATIRSQVMVDHFRAWECRTQTSGQEKLALDLQHQLDAAKADSASAVAGHLLVAAEQINKTNAAAESARREAVLAAQAAKVERATLIETNISMKATHQATVAQIQGAIVAVEDKFKLSDEALKLSHKRLYANELEKQAIRDEVNKEKERAVSAKMAEIAALQIEKSKAEETLKIFETNRKKAEKLLIKAEAEKMVLTEAAKVAEKASLEEMQTKEKVFLQNQLTAAAKAKCMEEDYRALLDASYSDDQLATEMNRLKRILTDEHDAKMKLLQAEEESKSRAYKKQSVDDIAILKEQVRQLVATGMSREEKTTQLQTIVDEFKTANTRLEIELPREVGALTKEVATLNAANAGLVKEIEDLEGKLAASVSSIGRQSAEEQIKTQALQQQIQQLQQREAELQLQREATHVEERGKILALQRQIQQLQQRETELQTELQRVTAELSSSHANSAQREEKTLATLGQRDTELRALKEHLTVVTNDYEAQLKDESSAALLRMMTMKKQLESEFVANEEVHARQMLQATHDSHAEIATLQTTIGRKESAVAALEARIEVLVSRETSLGAQVDGTKHMVLALETECEAARARYNEIKTQTVPSKAVDELRSQRDDLTRRLNDTTSLLQESQVLQQTLMARVESASVQLEGFCSAQQIAEEDIKEKTNEIFELNTRFSAVTHSSDEELKKKILEIDELTQRHTSLVTQLTLASQTLASRESNLAESTRLGEESTRLFETQLADGEHARAALATQLADSEHARAVLERQQECVVTELKQTLTQHEEASAESKQRNEKQLADGMNLIEVLQEANARVAAQLHQAQARVALDTTQTSDVHARLAFAETERQQDKETHTEQLLRLETSRKVLEETHTEQVLHLETSRKVLEDAHAEQLLHFETSRKSLETSMAAKQASVAALEESLDEARREVATLRDIVVAAEAGDSIVMTDVHQRLISVEQENATLTAEMDTVLHENAGLRDQFDDSQLLVADLRVQMEEARVQQIEEAQRREFALPKKAEVTNGLHQPQAKRVTRAAPPTNLKSREDIRRTAGVHTGRLLRAAVDSWITACVDHRVSGLKSSFSALDFLTNQDGTLATHFPVTRLKRENLEIQKERMGSGSFADVFRGELKIKCAIKKLKQMPLPPAEILSFVREGEMMRLASEHPNIVKLLGIHVDSASYSLVQEYIQGTNLFDFMHKFKMKIPLHKQIAVTTQVCDAMAYLHSIRIVHRDLKSQNVIYQEAAGVCKLCDFGLARLMPPRVIELDPSQLGTGGTPAYQGPEVLKRHAIGFRVDVYGFGIMIWEMFTHSLPWSDCTLEQMTHKVAVANQRPPIPKGMHVELSSLMQRCWESDPANRPDFSNILPVLEGIKELLPAPPPSPHLMSSANKQARAGEASTSAATNTRAHVLSRPSSVRSSSTPSSPGVRSMPRPGQYANF